MLIEEQVISIMRNHTGSQSQIIRATGNKDRIA